MESQEDQSGKIDLSLLQEKGQSLISSHLGLASPQRDQQNPGGTGLHGILPR